MTKKTSAASKFGRMTDEEYVRAHWEWTRYLPNSVCAVISDGNGTTDPATRFDGPEAEAWAAAAEFTHDRLEEIRQLREEIEMVRGDFGSARSHIIVDLEADWTVECFRWARILARLESIRAELQRGMKS